jgi:hypothetical protein
VSAIAAKRAMQCNCIQRINALIADRNTKLVTTLNFVRGIDLVRLETETLVKKRGAKPALIIPTYCPFCGKKYPESK